MKTENDRYAPFTPVKGVYESIDKGLLLERALRGMQQIIGVRKEGFDTLFRDVVTEVFDSEYPDFRCSAFRAIIEGQMGIKPMQTLPPACSKRMNQILTALDVLETIAYKWLENQIKVQSVEVRSDAKTLASAHGSIKLPRLFEALYDLEDSKPSLKTKRKKGKHTKV